MIKVVLLGVVVAAAAALGSACGKGASSPSNADNADEEQRGVTNTQPSLGSYGTGDDGTNGGDYDPGAVGAGVSNPTSAGGTNLRAPDAGQR